MSDQKQSERKSETPNDGGQEAQAPVNTAINQTLNQTIDQTMLDQTVDTELNGTIQRDSSAVEPPPIQMEFQDPDNLYKQDTSSKKYNQMRAKWGNVGDQSHSDFKFAPEVGNQDLTEKQRMNNEFDKMSAAQMEVFSAQMTRMYHETVDKWRAYWCFVLLILISLGNTIQRSSISFMFTFADPDQTIMYDPHYSIRDSITDFDDKAYQMMAGDSFTIIYAFMVLFTGSLSDLYNRKTLLCGACFGWCLCTYLSSFATSFWQLYTLRLIQSFFTAFSGPCSYSLITDWIPPEHRTLSYAFYALGVQFGGPLCPINTDLIEWLGWRATFQFVALIGFIILAISLLSFDEPERGRFDVAQSVLVNPNDASVKSGSQANGAYELTEDSMTRRRLNIQRKDPSKDKNWLTDYLKAVREIFVNDCALWILLAACLRTQQGIAMSLFNGEYFQMYAGYEKQFSFWSTVGGLAGSFICTLGTAIISDRYDNINYMTKAYICLVTTMISIPCCLMIYLTNENFWVCMTGLFIEYLLSTGWGQPAISILSTVCDASIRGTAISVFFFLITIFGVICPYGYIAIQNYYQLDYKEEPREFGILVAACTVIPCILALPCFYIAGVKYSWFKYHEAMFQLDVWGEMEKFYQDQIIYKRTNQMTGDPAEKSVLSASIDWKEMKYQRKMKVKDLKQRLEESKKETTAGGGRDTLLNRHKTIMGEMADDVSKRSFVRQQMTDHDDDSGHIYGPDGRKIAFSQENLMENDLLDSYKERFFQQKFGNGQYMY